MDFGTVRWRNTTRQFAVGSISKALVVLKDAGVCANEGSLLTVRGDGKVRFEYLGRFSEQQCASDLIERPGESGALQEWIRQLFEPLLEIIDCRVGLTPAEDGAPLLLVLIGWLSPTHVPSVKKALSSLADSTYEVEGCWYALD